MINTLRPDSTTDLSYANSEVDRYSGSINRDFIRLDDRGPIGASIDIARNQAGIAILDAGCGTGHGLADLKDQVSFRAPLAEALIEAHGVTLSDVRAQSEAGHAERARLSNGYIQMKLGNLATIQLQPEFYDLAYSYEVLLHNESVAPILANVTESLRPGGVYYFNSLVEQVDEVEAFASHHKTEVSIQTDQFTRQQIGGTAERAVHKITKIL